MPSSYAAGCRTARAARHSLPAHDLSPAQRQQLARDTLAGTRTVTVLARQAQVSRQFVYQQAARAEQALQLGPDYLAL